MSIQRITDAELKQHVLTICQRIVSSNWKPDYVVGIARGGLLPAVLISQFFNVPCNALKVSFTDNQFDSNTWMPEDAHAAKNILIVDDINDSGRTLNWIVNDWSSTLPAANWSNIWLQNVRFAVLVDKQTSAFQFNPNYSAVTVPVVNSGVWWEFPWESWWAK